MELHSSGATSYIVVGEKGCCLVWSLWRKATSGCGYMMSITRVTCDAWECSRVDLVPGWPRGPCAAPLLSGSELIQELTAWEHRDEAEQTLEDKLPKNLLAVWAGWVKPTREALVGAWNKWLRVLGAGETHQVPSVLRCKRWTKLCEPQKTQWRVKHLQSPGKERASSSLGRAWGAWGQRAVFPEGLQLEQMHNCWKRKGKRRTNWVGPPSPRSWKQALGSEADCHL